MTTVSKRSRVHVTSSVYRNYSDKRGGEYTRKTYVSEKQNGTEMEIKVLLMFTSTLYGYVCVDTRG